LELTPVTAASGVCWEGVGLAAVGCGSALAPPGWSASCREEDHWEGALVANLAFPPLLLAWVGLRGLASTVERPRSMATALERARTVQPQ
jgi:hypothetical protein